MCPVAGPSLRAPFPKHAGGRNQGAHERGAGRSSAHSSVPAFRCPSPKAHHTPTCLPHTRYICFVEENTCRHPGVRGRFCDHGCEPHCAAACLTRLAFALGPTPTCVPLVALPSDPLSSYAEALQNLSGSLSVLGNCWWLFFFPDP